MSSQSMLTVPLTVNAVNCQLLTSNITPWFNSSTHRSARSASATSFTTASITGRSGSSSSSSHRARSPSICSSAGSISRMALWLGAVLVGTAIAGLRGALPGVEPRPYIIRFTEDRPNPLYRRVCYTFAWSEVITFAVLNATGLVVAIVTGQWYLKQIYQAAYFPLAGSIWLLGALGKLPRVKPSTKGEGHERRYFYGSVWAVCWAQPVLWLMWLILPRSPSSTFSSWPSSSASSRSSAIWHVSGDCRVPVRSFPGSSRCRTEPIRVSGHLVIWHLVI